jgi:hypothetical protein
MSYQPQVNVVDTRNIRDNLIEHFKNAQAETLKWANDGAALPIIKDFHKAPGRLVTQFPALTFLQLNSKSRWENILESDLTLTVEVAIIGKQDVITDQAPKYSMAVESMLVNVPETTFNQDSIIEVNSTGMAVETTFAVQGKYKSQFIEVFQTRAIWRIEASAFSN